MSSDIAAAQALKEKLARLEDQERAKDIKAHATKTSSPRKQWSSPMLLNQDTTKNNNRLRNEMPLLSLDGRSGVEEAKFDPTPESDVIVVQVAASAEDNEKTRADSSSSMESPVLEAVVESVVTTSYSSSNSSSQHAPQKGEPTQSERKAVRTTFAGGARTRYIIPIQSSLDRFLLHLHFNKLPPSRLSAVLIPQLFRCLLVLSCSSAQHWHHYSICVSIGSEIGCPKMG